ncbi:hypothetical protein SLS54_005295, partial [Diplodia seriata]
MRVFGPDQLRLLSSTIQQICNISGVPGASVGVLQHGRVVYKESFGYQDVEAKIRPTSSTLYGIGSLTKAFVAAGIGKLVDDGLLTWETHVKDILPDFEHSDRYLSNSLTVADILSHRSGLSGSLSLTFQGDGNFLLPRDQLYPMVNHLPQPASLRTEWIYNNWGYAMAGEIIQHLSKLSVQEFLSQHIFVPLGMSNTTIQPTFDSENNPKTAKPYAALDDARPYLLPRRQNFKDSFFESAGGAYSNLEEMLVWAKAILHGSQGSGDGDTSPLKQIPMVLSNHVSIMNPSLPERSYGMGWIRSQLPGKFGLVGDNCELFPIEELPTLGKGSEQRLLLYHQGATVGYYSAIYLDPATESAVVVLTNSIAMGDAADWISQAVVQTLLGSPEDNDYVKWARSGRETILRLYEHLEQQITEGHDPTTKPESLEPYIGRYYNDLGNFFIEIRPNPADKESLV